MSRLLDFYRGTATDSEGRWLRDLWQWNDDELEVVHDFIQWMFPLPEPSQFNPDAPLLTEEDIGAFRTDKMLRLHLQQSFGRIISFLGLEEHGDGRISEGPKFRARAADVWTTPNHNWLRITRILRSMTLLGLAPEAQALYACLSSFHQSRRFPIPDSTFSYWTTAVRSNNLV